MAKVSSAALAKIAGRILAGKDYSTKDVKALAASVVAQAPAKKKRASGANRV